MVTPEKTSVFFLEFHLYHMILESGCLHVPYSVRYTLGMRVIALIRGNTRIYAFVHNRASHIDQGLGLDFDSS